MFGNLFDDLESVVEEDGYQLVELESDDQNYLDVQKGMESTILQHNNGISFTNYTISKIYKVVNYEIFRKYQNCLERIEMESGGCADERRLFHGTPFAKVITEEGFRVERAKPDNMFGAGIYFAESSSKCNQYAYGVKVRGERTITLGCPTHRDKTCYTCTRTMLLSRVCLGKKYEKTTADRACLLPDGYHSIFAVPGVGGVRYPEYVIYNSSQAYPGYYIEYTINPPS